MEFRNLQYPFSTKEITVREQNRIVFADEGQSEQVLFFIHDLQGYIPFWKNVVQSLRSEFRCIVVDLPGFGKSSKEVHTGRMTFYSDIVFEFLELLQIPKVNIVGHGMGGQIGINISSYYPGVVDKLILAAPTGFEHFTEDEIQWYIEHYNAEYFSKMDEKQVFIEFRNSFFDVPAEAEFILKERLRIRRDYEFFNYCHILANSVTGMIKQPLTKKLVHIENPVLMLFGENDAIIPNQFLHRESTTQIAKTAAQKIKNCRLLMIPSCGHNIPLEKPGLLSDEIKKFMAGE